MSLHEIFSPELIKIALNAENKEQVFEEMVSHFCRIKSLDTSAVVLEALWERENKMSTGIRKGIAVPHGKIAALDKVYGILGISKKGIDYDALDGHPVYIVFMLLTHHSDTEIHLHLLKSLAELLKDAQFYEELLAQEDPQGVSDIIKKYEDIHIASG